MRTSFKQVVNSGDSEESEVPALLNATRRVYSRVMVIIDTDHLVLNKDQSVCHIINSLNFVMQYNKVIMHRITSV
jgi:hypothetical protein